jgi:hypothetical protein
MKDKFDEIFYNTIPHSSFLSKQAIDSCMHQAYMLGKHEDEERYAKLRKAFLELLENWGDFGKYNSGRNQMEEDWKKQGGLI